MISEQYESWSKLVQSHRNVYRFGGNWANAMLTLVPWLNALVIAVVVYMVNNRMVVSPGVMFDLPKVSLKEGVHTELTALMISVSRDLSNGDETLIFFDDERYSVRDDEQMGALVERLRSRAAACAHRDLLLLADKRVPHGDVMRFVNVARDAGVQRVNVAEKPE